MYEKGDRVTQNYSKAHIHYTRAAESDIGLAAYRLGLLHEKGLGVEKNDEKAIFNYKYAIRLGYKEGEHGVRWLTLKKELGTQPKPQYSN
jgi:TPR repeat protein